ncbi:MAG TPA: metalloregulator ArsR/SmtB family transcription factor [Acidimicrobiales bacterium]|nr:metalloregulator ArsR/SmtB family transcription factor [Acidimicrobiales bacterium]
MEDVFRALADPSRRELLDRLRERNGQTLRELCSGLAMARQSVTKHLAVLEAASLVTTVRRGREKLHYLNAAPINDLAERWMSRYDRTRLAALSDLKRALEEHDMDRPQFVYTTYIRTSPERLWQALTDPAFTRRYWGAELRSDWQPGSEVTWEYAGVTVRDPEQLVLEATPPRRLSYTWQSITPEFATAVGFDDEYLAKVSAEPRSKVTFELQPVDELVKLTVVHDGFQPGSAMLESISDGWPWILSALKSLLETDEPLLVPPA